MGRRLIVVLLIAGLIAGGVFFLARTVQRSAPPVQQSSVTAPQPPRQETSMILVAAKDLPAGTIIQANSLSFRSWPRDAVDEAAYVLQAGGSIEEFDGAVVRSGIRAGEPVIRTKLIKRGERGFLAAVLKPGMRAVSAPINETTGVSGFVFPGDYVDLMLSHVVNMSDSGTQVRPHNVTETILHNIRVIAMDQRSGDQEQAPAVGRVTTFEVTPEQAEKISLAQRMGELRLVLRPLSKTEEDAAAEGQEGVVAAPLTGAAEADQRTFTLDSDLSQIISAPGGGTGSAAGAGVPTSVSVIRGSAAAVEAQAK